MKGHKTGNKSNGYKYEAMNLNAVNSKRAGIASRTRENAQNVSLGAFSRAPCAPRAAESSAAELQRREAMAALAMQAK